MLRDFPSPSVAGCDAEYPPFLTYDAKAPDPDIGIDFECIATLGTGGCGFEQQLAAVEKAVTVHAAPGAANDGFLRPDAILAVLLVTDEDDCSAQDSRIFGDDDTLGLLNLRCFNNPEMVQDVEGFVDGLLSLKPGRPYRVVAAGLVGVPMDLVALSEADLASDDIMTREDFDAILADPRMEETIDYSPEGGGNRLVPSCDIPGLGIAFPPQRIIRFIRDVDAAGNGGLVQSICQVDVRAAMRALGRVIQSRLD